MGVKLCPKGYQTGDVLENSNKKKSKGCIERNGAYGNIEPTEYGASTSPDKELHRLVDRNEADLRATMKDTQKKLFTRYLESVLEYQTMSELMLFQNSFKLGARLMVEVMEE